MTHYAPIPYAQSKYIVCSSAGFLIPAIIFYWNGQYLYGHGLVITSAVSMNYWINVDYNSWRRTLDLSCAKISFIVYFVTGLIYTKSEYYTMSLMITVALASMFHISDSLSQKHIHEYEWVWCHMIFHWLMTINLICIAQSIEPAI